MEKEQFISDKLYSTYWWTIKLDPHHPGNYNRNVTEIHGYSKRVGHDEAKDKAELLMKKIIMLHSHGYFERGKFIIISMKDGEFLNKSNTRTLLSLAKKDYKIHPDCISDKLFYEDFFIKKGVLDFLTRFYDCVSNGKDIKFLLPKSRATFSKDDYLNVSKQSFQTRKQLYAYCERMIKNGHPYEAVISFQRKYEDTKSFS